MSRNSRGRRTVAIVQRLFLRVKEERKAQLCAARVYYYHSERMPLFLLTAYGKSVKSDLAESEKVVMRRLVQELKDQFLR